MMVTMMMMMMLKRAKSDHDGNDAKKSVSPGLQRNTWDHHGQQEQIRGGCCATRVGKCGHEIKRNNETKTFSFLFHFFFISSVLQEDTIHRSSVFSPRNGPLFSAYRVPCVVGTAQCPVSAPQPRGICFVVPSLPR